MRPPIIVRDELGRPIQITVFNDVVSTRTWTYHVDRDGAQIAAEECRPDAVDCDDPVAPEDESI